jgi:hypothetical protein
MSKWKMESRGYIFFELGTIYDLSTKLTLYPVKYEMFELPLQKELH